jgi:FtsH-binding integral membrane protein
VAIEGISRKRRGFTLTCRSVCSALIAAPLLYVTLVVDGDAYHFLALVLLAPVAGFVLAANSLFCIFRYRNLKSLWIGLLFILIGAIGVLEALHFLPQFRM